MRTMTSLTYGTTGTVSYTHLDINPVLEGIAVRGIEIQMISDLPFFLKENQIEIAILTLPKNKAGDMANILIENGIKAIWNFAHIDLDTPDDVIAVSYTHLDVYKRQGIRKQMLI